MQNEPSAIEPGASGSPTAEAAPPEGTPEKPRKRSLVQWAVDKASSAGTAVAKGVKDIAADPMGTVARPTGKAVEEVADATVNLGADILATAGYKSIDPDFALWYDNLKPDERQPLKVGQWAEEAYGEKPEGFAGFAEDMIQFAEGMFLANRALKIPGVMGKSAAVGKAGAAVKTFFGAGAETVAGKAAATIARRAGAVTQLGAAGFAADAAFMDPYENNFFGIVEKSPSSVQSAVQRALAADEDSPETWNRLKVGLQGIVVGKALEKVLGAARSVYLWRKLKKLPAGSPERVELEKRLKGIFSREQAPARQQGSSAGTPVAAAENAAEQAPVEQLRKQAPVESGGRPNTAAQEFSSKLDESLGIGAQSDGEWVDVALKDEAGNGGVRVAYELKGGNRMHLKTIESLENGGRSGLPTKVMKEITRLADEHGITITLNASPFGEKALSREALRDFYRKFGFEQAEGGVEGLMVRNAGDVDAGFREVAKQANPQPVVRMEFDVIKDADGNYRFAQNGQPLPDSPVFRTAGEANTAAATMNDFIPEPTSTLKNMTAQIQKRIMSGVNPQDTQDLLDGTVFNFHWVSSADNARAWINAFAEAVPKAHEIATQTMEETAEIAQKLFGGSTPQEALQIASDVLGAVDDLPGKIMGLRAYQHSVARYVAELSEKIDVGGGNGIDAAKLNRALGTLFALNPRVKRIGTRVGQSLNAFKGDAPMPGVDYVNPGDAAKAVPLGPEGAVAATKPLGPKSPAAAGLLGNLTKTELRNLARNIRLAGGDPAVVDHYLRNVMGVTPPKPDTPAWAVFQSIRYNSLLSGTLTHAKNVVSNFGMILLKNGEMMSEGLQTGNREQFEQGVAQLSALWHDSWESLVASTKAMRTGTAQLDTEIQREGVQEILDALTKGGEGSTPKRWLTTLWKAHSTFLMAEDEFFKQLNYRGSVRAQAYAEARRLGLPPEKWGDFVEQTMDGAFTRNGGGVNTTALDLARENTFQRELQGLARDGSNLIGKSKALSFFFPFRRTPVNVFLAAAERTPGLWRMSVVMREELAGMHGPKRAADALAKVEMGQNLWLFATGLAAAGHLTGGGPRDKELRRQKESTGWIPYAIKGPDGRMLSIRAIEPLSTLFGIAADASEVYNDLSREGRRKEFGELVGAFILGTASNITNKTFMKGLLDMSNLLSGQQGAGETFLSSLGQQVVPFGGFLAQTGNTDDVQRDAQTVTDRILTRIPFYSPDVEPVRTVLGKPLMKQSWVERSFMPITFSEEAGTEEQALISEITQGLGEGVQIPLPASSLYRGIIDLKDRSRYKPTSGKDQSPYDRMLELYSTGITSPEGDEGFTLGATDLPPVEDALRAMVSEDKAKLAEIFGPNAYKFSSWKSARPIDGIDVTESDTRLGMLRGVMKIYKEAAYAQVLREYPALAADEDKIAAEKGERKEAQSEREMGAFQDYLGTAVP
jgi:hypothetical protein